MDSDETTIIKAPGKFKEGDYVTFVGGNLQSFEQRRIVDACRKIGAERGLRRPDQIRGYLERRLTFVGRRGLLYIKALPDVLEKMRAASYEAATSKRQHPSLVPPLDELYGCDGFLVIDQPKAASRLPVSVLPVMFAELELVKPTSFTAASFGSLRSNVP